MEDKQFNKENILSLIYEKRILAKFAKDSARSKKEKFHYEGWIEMLDILECKINNIWKD